MFYKLICSDLDDTLITDNGELTAEVKDSVLRYVSAGGKFCIVTGRMTVGAVPICRELGLSGELVTYQGAVITDLATGEILDRICISTADAVEIGKFMEERKLYYQTYVGDVFVTQKANNYTVLYGRISKAEFLETEIPLSEYIEKNGLCPPKLLLLEDPTRVPAVLKALKENFGDKFRINTSKPYIIEIIPKGISKAVAVEKLAKRHGIKREEIICIGDSENDIPMIDCAGLGVAVANASDEVKSYAQVIAPGNNDGGVAWTIDNIGFSESQYNNDKK